MRWKVGGSRKLIWILCSVFIPVFIIGGSAFILSVAGKPYVSSAFDAVIPLLVVAVASMLGGVGEEIGWRGFMLPAFSKKHSLLLSSVFTGLLWGAWHFGKISLFGITGYLLFIVLVTEWTVLMAWIFYNTGKSLTLMVAFHFLINICSVTMLNEREGISFYIAGIMLGGLLCLVVIIKNKRQFLSKALD
jgi:membrane protease YdiL (CAAX protease family)